MTANPQPKEREMTDDFCLPAPATAAALGCSTRTLARMTSDGTSPASRRVGGRLLYSRAAVAAHQARRLSPDIAGASAGSDFDRARQGMLAKWAVLVASGQNTELIATEVVGTANAMRGIASLLAPGAAA